MEVQKGRNSLDNGGKSVFAHAGEGGLSSDIDIGRISRQISWVLRRGARQSGVRIDSEGWVQIYELTQCKYFTDFTEKELVHLMTISNKSKRRYEIRKSVHGDLVRATWRDEEALAGLRASPKEVSSRDSAGSTTATASHLTTFGSASPSSSQAAAKDQSPVLGSASPLDPRLKATAKEFRPMSTYTTPVSTRARPPLEFTPVLPRQHLSACTLFSLYDAGQLEGRRTVPRVAYSSWTEKASLMAKFNAEEPGRVVTKRYAAANPGQGFCSTAEKHSISTLRSDASPFTPGGSPQHGFRGHAVAKLRTGPEMAHAEATSAELRVECSALTGGKPTTSDELMRLARESLLCAGFKAEDILRVRLNDKHSACLVEISLPGSNDASTGM
jgi:hypothetical protein